MTEPIDTAETIGLNVQIACVRREIGMRERAYPRWTATGKMSAEVAERELAAMRAVLRTLKALQPAETQRTLLL